MREFLVGIVTYFHISRRENCYLSLTAFSSKEKTKRTKYFFLVADKIFNHENVNIVVLWGSECIHLEKSCKIFENQRSCGMLKTVNQCTENSLHLMICGYTTNAHYLESLVNVLCFWYDILRKFRTIFCKDYLH